MNFSIPSFVLFSLYLLVILVPSFGSFDIIGPQWLYISIINSLCFLYLIFYRSKSINFGVFFKDSLFIVLASFFLLASISFFWAFNPTLWMQDIIRLFTFILMVFFSSLLIKDFKLTHIAYLFLFALSIEAIWSLWYLLLEFFTIGFRIFDAESFDLNFFKGVAGNKNITAASLTLKFAFSSYFLIRKNVHPLLRLLSILIMALSLIAIFILSARATFVSLILISIFFSLAYLIDLFNKRYFTLFFPIYFGFIMVTSFLIANEFIPDSKLKVADRVSSIEVSNQSSSNRLELWNNTIDQISSTPILGVGLGNWKIESSKYWKNYGGDYLVPYHAHNDFLEYTVELGIFGGALFLIFFLISSLRVFLMLFKNSKYHLFFIVVVASFIVYFVDAFLNFPYERPIMQSSFAVLIAISFFINSNDLYEN